MSISTAPARAADEKMDLLGSIPFWLIHLLCLGAIWTGVRMRDVVVCIALYYVRMWAITAGYHRYFSHRTYQTGRVFQFLLAFLGGTSAQKGALWWAAHHRHHHRESDTEHDIHSPVQKGFWWSHAGWILCPKYNETRHELIRDFARFPELHFLNKHHWLPPTVLGLGVWLVGGWSMLVVGFFWSTVLLWHGTFTINSLSHVFGSRRYKTTDTSRNNWFLALLTCGEGWHNNHHYHQNTANQGWFWWEVDASYYVLKGLSWVGVVKKLRTPDAATKLAHLKYTAAERAALRNESTFFKKPRRLVESALQAAKDSLPRPAAPAPQPLLKRR